MGILPIILSFPWGNVADSYHGSGELRWRTDNAVALDIWCNTDFSKIIFKNQTITYITTCI